ncbi:chemotaxis protein CheB [Methylomagnum ishizawai]|uniref:chemotaxis protein CheB n=1 Tax=Methylomagnum ishizawai TaxID=1760988 RepID=UPI001C325E2E|nr:chemotaxis protein CheB [Methylomagnum ishizawai]BBL74099.1 chemotaxis protein CheB [Methylomagnum ishizawai]
MPTRDIVVVGASAGGVEALSRLVGALPADFPASLFVVLHVSTNAISFLPEILARKGPLPACHPDADGEILPGRIYVAPPNRHMVLTDTQVSLVAGPRENGFRPGIDPLFRSAARHFGPRVVGVVLSGTLADGSNGLQVIKARGGTTIVQDPEEAVFAAMPLNAMGSLSVDHVLPVREIAHLLVRLATQPLEGGGDFMAQDARDGGQAVHDRIGRFEAGSGSAEATGLTCPECGGAIWELPGIGAPHYRCHIGHAFSAEGLLAMHSETLETALWGAVRALEEQASLLRRMALRFQQAGSHYSGDKFAEQSQAAAGNADVIRRVLLEGGTGGGATG